MVATYANNASNYIQWQVIRQNSSFLKRQRGINKHFSTEKFNLKKVNSLRYNGLVNKKAVDVQVSKDGKGIILTTKNKSKAHKPIKIQQEHLLNKNSRKTLKSVKNVVSHYKPGKVRVARKRTSQLLRSFKIHKPKSAKTV